MTKPMLTTKLIDLFSRLEAYSVEEWGTYDDSALFRKQLPWRNSEVISSKLKGSNNHVVILDIDYRAHLVPSTSEDHWHLYLEVPGGIPQRKYLRLLKKMAKYGVIEQNYYRASKRRGHTALRLPWIKK